MLQLIPTPPQATPDTTAIPEPDTATQSLAEALRADSTIYRLTNPSELATFFTSLRDNLLDPDLWFGLVGTLLNIVIILLITWLIIRLVDRVTKRRMKRFEELPLVHPRRQRAFTVSNLLSSSVRYVIWPLALIMILSEVNIDVGALIATAGIAGLAIGFGAQTLVKDVISGIFLLFDDSIHVGDAVRIGNDAGVVEYIGVRLIKVRKFDGELLMVPAGEVRLFGNRSIGFARAVVEVGLSYEQDVDAILPIVQRVADEWAAERKDILLQEQPEVHALLGFGDSAINIRIAIQVIPGEQWAAERALRMALKREFDRLGIEIPYPQRTIYIREGDARPPRVVEDDQPPAPATAPGPDDAPLS